MCRLAGLSLTRRSAACLGGLGSPESGETPEVIRQTESPRLSPGQGADLAALVISRLHPEAGKVYRRGS